MPAKITIAKEWSKTEDEKAEYSDSGLGTKKAEAQYQQDVANWHDTNKNATLEPMNPGGVDVRVNTDDMKEATKWALRAKGTAFRARESGFYGHYLPQHFSKTRIIDTNGR
jgi:hypothetical protein